MEISISDNYSRFADIMSGYGYNWEAVPVKTDDGFTLTTFHILGKTDELED